jgi:hypothetical protein
VKMLAPVVNPAKRGVARREWRTRRVFRSARYPVGGRWTASRAFAESIAVDELLSKRARTEDTEGTEDFFGLTNRGWRHWVGR